MNYLIPANAKRGQYIFGLFRPSDLILFGVGIGSSFLLMWILPIDQTWGAVTALVPGVVCSLLVLPVAYYHNVLQLIIELYRFFTNRRIYIWKGWCFLNGEDDNKQMDRRLDQYSINR